MGATSIGALIGGAIDRMSGGDDSSWDGAVKGAIIANVAKIVIPMAVTYAVGWAALKGAAELRHMAFGADTIEGDKA